jgi:hypothetical protein
VHGVHAGDLWPRLGRVLIAARTTTFKQLGRRSKTRSPAGTTITPRRSCLGEDLGGHGRPRHLPTAARSLPRLDHVDSSRAEHRGMIRAYGIDLPASARGTESRTTLSFQT